jgi:hypothetical protein
MKKFINSRSMKWFRRSFLNAIRSEILSGDEKFCCHVYTWHRLFISWKDLKEVKENLSSTFLKQRLIVFNCREVWFESTQDRLEFLNECISKTN